MVLRGQEASLSLEEQGEKLALRASPAPVPALACLLPHGPCVSSTKVLSLCPFRRKGLRVTGRISLGADGQASRPALYADLAKCDQIRPRDRTIIIINNNIFLAREAREALRPV